MFNKLTNFGIKFASFFIILIVINASECFRIKRENSKIKTEPVFNFTIPKNDPTNACIKLETSFIFTANYLVKLTNGSYANEQTKFVLFEADNFTYTGNCQPDKNMIEISFLDDWRLEFYFNKLQTTFLFNHVILYYKLIGPLFPGSIHNGAQSEVYDYAYINSTLQKAYECIDGIKIDLGEVSIHLKNFRIEPFFSKRPNTPFDSTVICAADEPLPLESNNNPWIISILIFFVVLIVCCMCFVYLKCSSRTKEYRDIKKEYRNIKKEAERDKDLNIDDLE